MKNSKLKGILNLILCLGVAMALFLVIMLSISVLGMVLGWESLVNYLNGTSVVENTPFENTLLDIVLSSAQNSSFILGTSLVALLIWKKKLKDLGLTNLKKNGKDLLVGLLVGIGGITVVFLLLMITGSVTVASVSTEYLSVVLLSFISYIGVGFGEEILSRGGFMLALKGTRSKLLIILVPSVIFGLMHMGNNGISVLALTNLFLFGLLASYCFYRSGNIWFPIGMHITWNYFQGNIFGFRVSGTTNYSLVNLTIVKENIFTGGEFGPEGGIGVTVALILMFLVVRFYYRNLGQNLFEQG